MGKNNLEILKKIKNLKLFMAKNKKSIQDTIDKMDNLFETYDDKQKQKNKKHKKQDTTHYTKYKQVAKPTKKKLATLADNIYRDNKITKSPYNKIYNLSIGASSLPALNTAYQSFKSFKDSDTKVKKVILHKQ
jgi:hypothetical protein